MIDRTAKPFHGPLTYCRQPLLSSIGFSGSFALHCYYMRNTLNDHKLALNRIQSKEHVSILAKHVEFQLVLDCADDMNLLDVSPVHEFEHWIIRLLLNVCFIKFNVESRYKPSLSNLFTNIHLCQMAPSRLCVSPGSFLSTFCCCCFECCIFSLSFNSEHIIPY